MTIELILDWAEVILEEIGSAIPTSALKEVLERQFQSSLPKLDILLSLDKRFSRNPNGNWSISRRNVGKSAIDELVDQTLSLKLQAIKALLEEQKDLKEKSLAIQNELANIERQLESLGYKRLSVVEHQNIVGSANKTERPSKDDRYKSIWPLPGGRSTFLKVLSEILGEVSQNSAFDELINWVKQKYQIGNWAEHAILACVVYPGLASRKGKRIELTEQGQLFLETKHPRIIGDCLKRNVWGISELISWLEQEELNLENILDRFNQIGSAWNREHQVRYRIDWMIAVGYVGEVRGSRPKRYKILKGE